MGTNTAAALMLAVLSGTPIQSTASDQSGSCRTEIVVELDGSSTPITEELSDYLASIDGFLTQVVGLNGADIGWGTGDGVDENVPFSLVFPEFTSICSAMLEIDYSWSSQLFTTDLLLFADNQSAVEQALFYGLPEMIEQIQPNSGTFRFDLTSLGTNAGRQGAVQYVDISELLLDGDLNVVFSDDQLIRGVRLFIIGDRPGCAVADLTEPYGVFDLADINTFTAGFLANDPIADLSGDGLFDLSDINLFVSSFTGGCL